MDVQEIVTELRAKADALVDKLEAAAPSADEIKAAVDALYERTKQMIP